MFRSPTSSPLKMRYYRPVPKVLIFIRDVANYNKVGGINEHILLLSRGNVCKVERRRFHDRQQGAIWTYHHASFHNVLSGIVMTRRIKYSTVMEASIALRVGDNLVWNGEIRAPVVSVLPIFGANVRFAVRNRSHVLSSWRRHNHLEVPEVRGVFRRLLKGLSCC
jgi:hypothetical protein